MSYNQFGNNLIKFGSNIFNSGESFILNALGKTFPEEINNDNTSYVNFEFSTQEVLTVNYGDGTIIQYTASLISTNRYQVYFRKKGSNIISSSPNLNVYSYADGARNPRTISFTFNRNKLTSLEIISTRMSIANLLFEITKYLNLKTFRIHQNTSIVGLNLEGSFALSKVESVTINNAFHSSSPYYTSVIPSSFLLMPLKSLGIGSFNLNASFASMKFDQIYLLKATLTNLTIEGTPILDDHFSAGALPSNFSELTNLKSFAIYNSKHTVIPSIINSIPSLVTLNVGYNIYLTGWGNLSNLINLSTLGIPATPNISVTLPSYLTSLTLLKTVYAARCFITQIRVDTYVDNWYSFITANASITGTNSLPFRGMIHYIQSALLNDGVLPPTGIYQQPTGYVLGSSNGTPISQKEKIWVMVNQYGHLWTTN